MPLLPMVLVPLPILVSEPMDRGSGSCRGAAGIGVGSGKNQRSRAGFGYGAGTGNNAVKGHVVGIGVHCHAGECAAGRRAIQLPNVGVSAVAKIY